MCIGSNDLEKPINNRGDLRFFASIPSVILLRDYFESRSDFLKDFFDFGLDMTEKQSIINLSCNSN